MQSQFGISVDLGGMGIKGVSFFEITAFLAGLNE
jgi:hypothetical protein